MGRRARPPVYYRHKGPKGLYYAHTRINGQRVSLGRYGSPESYAEYERVIIEWRRDQIARQKKPGQVNAARLTVADLIARFLVHAENHFRWPDGTVGSDHDNFVQACRPLAKLYGHILARDFGPLALKAVRQKMIESGWSRGVINHSISRIRHIFKWAESEELLPAATYHSLQTVAGLRYGLARETKAVLPVPEEVLARTLPLLFPIVRAMVEFQLFTGARPGEIIGLRPRDFDRSGKVELMPGFLTDTGSAIWSVRLEHHKTLHRGHHRVLLVGPKAQAAIAPQLEGRDSNAFLFSPQEAIAWWQAEKRKRRQSKVQPSQKDRRKRKAFRLPGPHYAVHSYCRAVRYAIEKANTGVACEPCKKLKPKERCKDCKSRAIPLWHPYQLRHNAATRLVEQFGWDVARIVLGHREVSTTRIYALDDIKKAAEAMAKSG